VGVFLGKAQARFDQHSTVQRKCCNTGEVVDSEGMGGGVRDGYCPRNRDQRKSKGNRRSFFADDEDINVLGASESLLSLVRPELDSLVCYWLAALRDSALLSLPAQFSDQMPSSGGAFYKAESAEECREYYRSSWPPICCFWPCAASKSKFEWNGEIAERRYGHLWEKRSSECAAKIFARSAPILWLAYVAEQVQFRVAGERREIPFYCCVLKRDLLCSAIDKATSVLSMPQINSAQMKSRSLAPLHMRRFGRLPAESAHLLRSGIQLLVNVPSLCSSKGRLVILPSVLYLIIGFIRESARVDENSFVPDLPTRTFDDSCHHSSSGVRLFQALRNLASAPPTDSTLSHWITMMQSALYSILLLCDADYRKDECVLMLSCVVLASVAPRQVVLGHRESFHRLVRLIRSQLHSEHPHHDNRDIQHASATRYVGHFRSSAVCDLSFADDHRVHDTQARGQQSFFSAIRSYYIRSPPLCSSEMFSEKIAQVSEFSLVSLLTQSLCRLLCASSADEWRLLSQPARRIHEFALQRLNAVAPSWPVEFKQVLASHPVLKKQLESALLFQSSRQVQAQQVAKAKAVAESKNAHLSQQPTIKLTMDFNAFGKAAS
ncbi:hypothetical protein OSTOST_19410, partial [Ostertagia ostertagi]